MSSSITNNGNTNGFVYLLREREFVNKGEYTYKIGRTSKENPYERIKQYSKGYELLLVTQVADNFEAEKIIKEEFRSKFTLVRLYGLEYFNGNSDNMKKVMLNIVDRVNKENGYTNGSHIRNANIRRTGGRRPLKYESDIPTIKRVVSTKIVKKFCKKCETDKPIDQFGVYNRSRDGFRSSCKQCTNEYNKKTKKKTKAELKKDALNRKRTSEINIYVKDINENYDDPEKLKPILYNLAKICDDMIIEDIATSENSIRIPNHILQDSDDTLEIIAHIIEREFEKAGIEVPDDYEMVSDIEYVKYEDEYLIVFDNFTISEDDQLILKDYFHR